MNAHFKKLIYLRQLSKEFPAESTEFKWLKSIIPFDYLNQQLDNTASQMNSNNSISTNNHNNRLSVNNSNSLSRRQSDQNLMSLQTSPVISNYTSESPEVINSLLKEPDSLDEYQILVVNINDKSLDCPGMLNEGKVIKEYQANLTSHSKLLLPKNKNTNSINSSKKTNRDQNILDFKVFRCFFLERK